MSGVILLENTVCCKIFYINLLVNFFSDLEISRRYIFNHAPKIGHKKMFLITLVETIINIFSRRIWQLLEQIWCSALLHDVTMPHNCILPYKFVAYTFTNHEVINQRKNSPDPWIEKAISLENWLISQYVAHSPVVEMTFFCK